MDKFKQMDAADTAPRSKSPLPVNGSIRLPNGQSFRYVRSDIMRDAIDAVTRRGQTKQP